MSDQDAIQISESELRAMTAQMNEMHEATMPTLRESLADFGAALRGGVAGRRPTGRRGFLVGGGAVLGGVALAACGSNDETSAGTSSSRTASASASPSASAGGKGDMAALATNASLENLAVFAYTSALTAAPKGMFGAKFPKAVAEFAMNASKQHTEHAAAFNAALKNAGGTAFTKPDPALAGPVTEMFGKLKDVPGLARLALTLENTAAATYTKQMGEFTNPEGVQAVATIAPVERQHAAILSFVLGEYPVPDTFVRLDKTPTSLGARPDDDAGQ